MKKTGYLLICIIVTVLLSARAVEAARKKLKVNQARPKAILWDLGYTLVRPSAWAVISNTGCWNSARMYLHYGSSSNSIINDTLFDILTEHDEEYVPCVPSYPEGRIMPRIFYDWLESRRSEKDILHQALQNANEYQEYSCGGHKSFAKGLLRWMFNPCLFGKSFRPIPKMVALLRKCARNPNNSLYVVSNWNKASFKVMYASKAMQCIFKHFKPENIFISGTMKDIKPHLSMYRCVLQQIGFCPSDCIFIDDQSDNIRAARACGMVAIQVRNGNTRPVRQSLKALGVI